MRGGVMLSMLVCVLGSPLCWAKPTSRSKATRLALRLAALGYRSRLGKQLARQQISRRRLLKRLRLLRRRRKSGGRGKKATHRVLLINRRSKRKQATLFRLQRRYHRLLGHIRRTSLAAIRECRRTMSSTFTSRSSSSARHLWMRKCEQVYHPQLRR